MTAKDSSLSRRTLLNLATGAVAGACALPIVGLDEALIAAADAKPRGQATRMNHQMQSYTAETFLPYVGAILTFEAPAEAASSAGVVRFELLEVSRAQDGGRPGHFREPFSLLFALRSGAPSAAGLHRLTHEDFSPSDWLLSRVFVPGKDPSVPYYEAVFG